MDDKAPRFSWSDPVDRSNRETRDEPAINPFTVIVDTREQAPWQFQGLRADSKTKYRPLVVFIERQGLKSGDYSIKGFEDQFSIERKSLADAFQTFTVERERFERELERLNEMKFAAVVIEGDWNALTGGPDRLDRSDRQREVIGKTCYRSILAWQQRFKGVHWMLMPSRDWAERTAFRIMQRFWEDREYEKKQARVEKMQRQQLGLPGME